MPQVNANHVPTKAPAASGGSMVGPPTPANSPAVATDYSAFTGATPSTSVNDSSIFTGATPGVSAAVAASVATVANNPLINLTGRVNSASTPTPQVDTGATAATTPVSTNSTMTPQQLQDAVENLLKGTAYPNPLNSSWQVTYHWRLFMMNDVDVYNAVGGSDTVTDFYKKIDGRTQITVAESGVTTYNIKSVEMRGLVGPNAESKNTYTTGFTIQIVEPGGVGFFDAIKEAALALKIKNIQKCPYFMELMFRGYNEQTGEIQTNVLDNAASLECSRWIWEIQIVDIDTHFDESGGQYTMTAIVYGDGVVDDEQMLRTPQVTTMGGTTVGEALNSFQTNLNKGWLERYGDDLVTYNFVMHPIKNPPPALGSNTDPSKFQLKSNNPNTSSIKISPMDQPGGISHMQIAAGTSFMQAVEYLFSNNEQSQNLGLDRNGSSGNTDASSNATNDRKFKESMIFRLENDIELQEYDHISGNYRKKVNVHIWPYYTQAILTGRTQVDNAEDPAVQGAMLTRLLELGFLRKHYDFLFTGRNTEVLQFDVKSSFKWNALLPKFSGARTSIENVSTTAVQSKDGASPEKDGLDVKNLTPEQKRAQVNKDKNALEQQTGLLGNIAGQLDTIKTDTLSAQATLLDPHSTVAQRQAASRQLGDLNTQQSNLTQQQSGALNVATVLRKRIDTINQSFQTSYNNNSAQFLTPKYAEDLLKPDGSALNATADQDYKTFNFNISFRQGWREAMTTTGTGMDGGFDRDRSLFGAMIDQLYQRYTTQLSNVDLEIRGDPFWIGMSNLHRQVLIRNKGRDGGSQDVSSGLPNIVAGDQVFLLTFRYPIGIGQDSVPVFRTDDTFNGIYRATEVVSTFDGGVFKQKLHGLILPLINVRTALSNVKKPSTAGQTASMSGSKPNLSGVQPAQTRLTSAQQQANASEFKAALLKYGASLNPPMTEAQADGIVANAYRESGMNPGANVIDSNGKPAQGLVQWNGGNATAFQSAMGVTPNNATIDQQAQYLTMQLGGTAPAGYNETRVWAAVSQQTTASGASGAFISGFERPANPSAGQSINLSYLPNLYGKGIGPGT